MNPETTELWEEGTPAVRVSEEGRDERIAKARKRDRYGSAFGRS